LLTNPEIEAHILRLRPKSYEAFVSQLYKDIDVIVSRISAFRQYHYTLDEDQLTVAVIVQLQALSYQANHDVANGGHVDIYVERNNYIWLGEAKIFKDNGYIMDGFYQLATRYSTGDQNSNCGGMLIYIKDDKTTDAVMTAWKQSLEQQHTVDPSLAGLSTQVCDMQPQCFHSTHKHALSGLDYRVRHIPMNISFNPKDGDDRPKMKRGRKKGDAKPNAEPAK
jgi:hypothetical protein